MAKLGEPLLWGELELELLRYYQTHHPAYLNSSISLWNGKCKDHFVAFDAVECMGITNPTIHKQVVAYLTNLIPGSIFRMLLSDYYKKTGIPVNKELIDIAKYIDRPTKIEVFEKGVKVYGKQDRYSWLKAKD